MRQQLGRTPTASSTPVASKDAGAEPTLQASPPVSIINVLAALAAAEGLVAAGRHGEALTLLQAAALPCTGLEGVEVPPPQQQQVQVHVLAALCQVQLGCLRDAVASYTAAIQLATAGHQALLCELLLARARLHEQLEQPRAALADVAEAGRLQHPLPHATLLAADRLKRACGRGGN